MYRIRAWRTSLSSNGFSVYQLRYELILGAFFFQVDNGGSGTNDPLVPIFILEFFVVSGEQRYCRWMMKHNCTLYDIRERSIQQSMTVELAKEI